MLEIIPALPDLFYSDIDSTPVTVSKEVATEIFDYFHHHSLFNWRNAHNGCEGRADAICRLLKQWQVPNYKAWVFGGAFLKNHIGGLKSNWNYHVAAAIPVQEDGGLVYYVIDPSTRPEMQPVHDWAINITDFAHSYYFLRHADWYIFPPGDIRRSAWIACDRRNYKWMIQCLAGINSLSTAGKAALVFRKKQLRNTGLTFEQLKNLKPF